MVVACRFQSNRDECILILRMAQGWTRYLQNVCANAKVTNDVSLAKNVPRLKLFLEQFVFRVKETLALNNAVKAFWLGNLKNRNYQGEDIDSQIADENDAGGEDEGGLEESDSTTTEGNNDDLPEDDSSSDIDGDLDEVPENADANGNDNDENSFSIEY